MACFFFFFFCAPLRACREGRGKGSTGLATLAFRGPSWNRMTPATVIGEVAKGDVVAKLAVWGVAKELIQAIKKTPRSMSARLCLAAIYCLTARTIRVFEKRRFYGDSASDCTRQGEIEKIRQRSGALDLRRLQKASTLLCSVVREWCRSFDLLKAPKYSRTYFISKERSQHLIALQAF